jgi:cyclopropane fatty-acyl-phospholipid synthase-like methyltransferase
MKKNTESVVDGLELNDKCTVISRGQNAVQNCSIKFDKISLESVEDFEHLGKS